MYVIESFVVFDIKQQIFLNQIPSQDYVRLVQQETENTIILHWFDLLFIYEVCIRFLANSKNIYIDIWFIYIYIII